MKTDRLVPPNSPQNSIDVTPVNLKTYVKTPPMTSSLLKMNFIRRSSGGRLRSAALLLVVSVVAAELLIIVRYLYVIHITAVVSRSSMCCCMARSLEVMLSVVGMRIVAVGRDGSTSWG